MGTSASRNGPRPTTPLLPDWPGIPPLPPPPVPLPPPVPPLPPLPPALDPADSPPVPPDPTQMPPLGPPPSGPAPAPPVVPVPAPAPPPPANRYNTARQSLKKYAQSAGTDRASARKAVREYVRTAGGGPQMLARRMFTSVQAVGRLSDVLTDFVQQGVPATLAALNLASHVGKDALDVLSALLETVVPASGLLDNAMTGQAYESMVERMDAAGSLSINNLSQVEVHEVLAVFIEETIFCRVVNDIGAALMTEQPDPAVCADMMEDLYQIVSGAVHQDILSGLSGTNSQLPPDTGQRMENIYQLALEVLSDV